MKEWAFILRANDNAMEKLHLERQEKKIIKEMENREEELRKEKD